MELDGDSQPIWSQPTTTLLRQRRRQPPCPPIINPVVLILLLPILALFILFFVVPPFLTHTTQILRPNSVKKGWDSFNILLVVFAILCGIFARKNDENSSHVERNRNVETSHSGSASADHDMRHPVSNDRWFEPSHEKAYNFGAPETAVNRLRRSSSSYPDLRQVPQWETGENQSRFYDDFGVNLYRSMASDYDIHRQRRRERQRDEPDIKVIPVDIFESRSSPPEPPSSPEKPPITSSKPPQANLKRRRSFHSVPPKDKAEMQSNEAEVEHNEKQEPPPPSPPMPTDLSPPVDKPQKLQRRKSGTKELATAIASLYNQSKRKRRTNKRDKIESVSDSLPSAEQVLPPATPPPPPPPPPPPSKVFQNLFKKNRKSKRVHSDPSNVPSPPPPPPPPPPNSIFNNLFKTGSKSKRFQQTASSNPPPPPPPPPPSSILNNLFKHGTKSRRFKSSISTPAPPPPPPPPPPPQAHVSSRWRKGSTHFQPPMQPPEPSRRSSWSKPPLPTKLATSYYDDNLNSGSQSPLIPMPPPPPMPPFKMREMNFVPSGDFVRIPTAHSSRCSSPDLEDVDVDVDDVSVRSAMDGEDLTGPSVSCPSPDVNMKADTFIARLRDEWRLEKMNSLREKSTLG